MNFPNYPFSVNTFRFSLPSLLFTKTMPNRITPIFTVLLLILVLPLIFTKNGEFVRFAEGGKRRIHITDDLDDVVDDEEDEAWKEWGKKSTPSSDFDLPPNDLSKMELSEIQSEMMKRHSGPVFGFVKLRLGVKRTQVKTNYAFLHALLAI